jgi:hypothetical protein
MATINKRRVLIGALGGTIFWLMWSMVVQVGVLWKKYPEAQAANLLLDAPRYPLFFVYWIITLFLLSYLIAWFYAHLRESQGPGPATALKLGLRLGFFAAVPYALSVAAWSPLNRVFPLWWGLELWVGACLSAIVSGWLYKEPSAAKPAAAA